MEDVHFWVLPYRRSELLLEVAYTDGSQLSLLDSQARFRREGGRDRRTRGLVLLVDLLAFCLKIWELLEVLKRLRAIVDI